ncbi:endoglucanase 13 [Amborella trichopoda]|uniref:endoglucanase 13 n=1 Tax=Amborella trichopoda TaxID=13333 RepID=UPI0005D3CA23|nr:endoglucanase 13 [Amborella trichopoda]|eukprot:XP_011623034.1 endoglucanase 13 [Amborella trichopoda]
MASLLMLVCLLRSLAIPLGQGRFVADYGEALDKSLLYFEAQRSGKLPTSQRVLWRGDSALSDGHSVGVDLTGGYYDAGDNMKFGFPMAFTVTMLAWSVVEFGEELKATSQLDHAMNAIWWGTEYLMKAHIKDNVLYGQVGDGSSDHNCWQRPEDMTTPRTPYVINETNPGSDLAAETAAALAAAAIAFKDDPYHLKLLDHSQRLNQAADRYQGKYSDSIPTVQNFYASNGFNDELQWAAMWLWEATQAQGWLDHLQNWFDPGPVGPWLNWNEKFVGVQALIVKGVMLGQLPDDDDLWERYTEQFESFLCQVVQLKSSTNQKMSPGGLLHFNAWDNLQYVTTTIFLLVAYSKWMDNPSSRTKSLECKIDFADSKQILGFARAQVDYILGNNPLNMSYMVGYGSKYPMKCHHRGASIVSVKKDPTPVSCQGGFDKWFNRNDPNPNVLDGALVGGPDENDQYSDARANFQLAEPSIYNTAPLVGVLARLASMK